MTKIKSYRIIYHYKTKGIPSLEMTNTSPVLPCQGHA